MKISLFCFPVYHYTFLFISSSSIHSIIILWFFYLQASLQTCISHLSSFSLQYSFDLIYYTSHPFFSKYEDKSLKRKLWRQITTYYGHPFRNSEVCSFKTYISIYSKLNLMTFFVASLFDFIAKANII